MKLWQLEDIIIKTANRADSWHQVSESAAATERIPLCSNLELKNPSATIRNEEIHSVQFDFGPGWQPPRNTLSHTRAMTRGLCLRVKFTFNNKDRDETGQANLLPWFYVNATYYCSPRASKPKQTTVMQFRMYREACKKSGDKYRVASSQLFRHINIACMLPILHEAATKELQVCDHKCNCPSMG